jgi:hypothetical protein
MIKRKKNWGSILAKEIDKAARAEFQYGEHDCCVWTTSVIDALLGTAISKLFRGTYITKFGALRQIKEYGGDLEGAAKRIASEFGGEEIDPAFIQRGDCGLLHVQDEDGQTLPALGICIGSYLAVVARKGLVQIPIDKVEKAWRV